MFQVETIRINPYYTVSSHPFFEYSFVRQGGGTLRVNGFDYRISEGSLLFLTPFHLYSLMADGGAPLEIVRCCSDWHFSYRQGGLPVPQKSAVDGLLDAKPCVDPSPAEREAIEQIFAGMALETENRDRFSRIACEAYLLSLYSLYGQIAARRGTRSEGGRR